MFFKISDVRYMQYLSVCVATMTITSVSMYGAWPSPVLRRLRDENSPLGRPVTDEEGSWIASISTLATPASCIFAAWFINKTGRKGSLMVSSVILLIPWIIIYFAESVTMICVGRLIGGIAFGCVYTATAMYSGEVAEPDIRGILGLTTSVMKLLGSFLVLSMGPFLSHTNLSLLCATVPVLFFLLMTRMPESPYHLVLHDKKEEAREVLLVLSKGSADDGFIDKRLLEIEFTIENDMQNKGTLWELLTNSEYRQALLISIAIKSLNQFCGVIAIESYMESIIADSGSSVSPEVSSIIFGTVQIPAAIVATLLIDRVGRKPLLMVSSIGCALAMASEGAYFYLQDDAGTNVEAISWLPTTGIVAFLIMNNVGITTVPMVLLSEIFPTNVKGTAIALNTFYGSTLSFLVSKFFKPVSNAIGMHYTFFVFAGACVLGAVFVPFMPETKGKTFVEIQTKLNKRYIKRKLKKELKAAQKAQEKSRF